MDRNARRVFGDFSFDGFPLRFRDLPRFRQENHARPRQCFRTFPQEPARQEMPAAERICRIDEDDIRIPRQFPILKPVVQEQEIYAHRFGRRRGPDPILSYQNRHAGELLRQHIRLVPRFPLRKTDSGRVCDDAAHFFKFALVAARDNRRAKSLRQRPFRETHDARCFSRAARRDVADGNDRDARMDCSRHVLRPPGPHAAPVHIRQRRKPALKRFLRAARMLLFLQPEHIRFQAHAFLPTIVTWQSATSFSKHSILRCVAPRFSCTTRSASSPISFIFSG